MQNTRTTLLIVDDEPSIREALSHTFTELGYRVRCAEDGFSALRELRSEIPKLLISDLNMPNMSGFELLSVVRRRFPEVHTIAMSGSFTGNEVPSGVSADGFYQKGSSVGALLRIMENLPSMDRHTTKASSPDALFWIHSDTRDTSQGAYVTITCPECLRTFPQTLDTGYLKRKTDCIYCGNTIHYAIVQPEDRMPLQSYQRMSAGTMPFPRSAVVSIY